MNSVFAVWRGAFLLFGAARFCQRLPTTFIFHQDFFIEYDL